MYYSKHRRLCVAPQRPSSQGTSLLREPNLLRFCTPILLNRQQPPPPLVGRGVFQDEVVGALRRGPTTRATSSYAVSVSGTNLYPKLAAFFANDFAKRS